MKFFAVFAAIVAVACGSPTSWTINQLSEAIESPHTSVAYLPYLEQALNEMMAAIFAGQPIETVTVSIPSIEVPSMTLSEVSAALENPETNPALVPYLEEALNEMMEALVSGLAPVAAASTSITVPAMDITFWTLSQLSEALQNPSTNAALVPYLENALNQIMHVIASGEQTDFTVIATPAGIIPVEAETPADIIFPIVPVMPTPVEAFPVNPAAPSSPLVQIIINIKQQETVVGRPPIAIAQPVLVPESIDIEQAPVVVPESVSIVEQAPIAPEPILIVDQTPVASVPIGVASPSAPISVNPIGVVSPA